MFILEWETEIFPYFPWHLGDTEKSLSGFGSPSSHCNQLSIKAFGHYFYFCIRGKSAGVGIKGSKQY